MNPRFRKVAVFAGVAALAGAAGVGLASQGSSEAASSGAPMTRPAGDDRQQGGGPGSRLADLADELGVSESALEEALQDIRPSGPSSGGADSFAQALAAELDISVAKVQEALEAARPDGGQDGPPAGAPPGGGAPPSGTAPGTTDQMQ